MKLALIGDIGLLGNYSIGNNREIIDQLAKVRRYLSSFDYVVGNLETPFSRKKEVYGAKSSYICTEPENVAILKALNINAVSLANNHIYDFGSEGFKTTIETLEKNHIEWFGADGKNLKIEIVGNKVVFEGFCCYSSNPIKLSGKKRGKGVNRFNLKEVKEIIDKNAQEGYLNILSIHSGIEHVDRPSIDQIKASHLLANNQRIVWYGHHPHVIQGVDYYNGSIIAHSLGNFCFAGNTTDKNRPIVKLSEHNQIGLILEIEIENNQIVDSTYKLIRFNNEGEISILDSSEMIEQLSSYITQALTHPEEYNSSRIQQRSKYVNYRKSMRNFSWLLKHLRLRYVLLYLQGKANKRKYSQNVKKFLLQ